MPSTSRNRLLVRGAAGAAALFLGITTLVGCGDSGAQQGGQQTDLGTPVPSPAQTPPPRGPDPSTPSP